MMESFSLLALAEGMGGELRQGSGTRLVHRLNTDSRTLQAGDCFVALKGDRFDGHDFVPRLAETPAVAAVVSQAELCTERKDFGLVYVPDTLEALQKFSHFYRRRLATKIVGITGSSGKTSTKEMIASVLRQRFRTQATRGNLNNHIGVPLTLLELMHDTEYGVVEMGMNHRGEIKLLADLTQPDIAVITNIGQAHLEHLGTEAEIALEKSDLIAALPAHGVAVLNADDEWSQRNATRTSAQVIWAGQAERALVQAQNIVLTERGMDFDLRIGSDTAPVRLPLFSRAMVQNALLAAGVGAVAGLTLEEIVRGLAAVKLVGQRLEVQRWAQGWIINDVYNANPDSMRVALQSLREFPLGKRHLAVLGSMGELGAAAERLHQEVGEFAAQNDLSHLVAVGPNASALAAGARGAGLISDRISVVSDAAAVLPVLREILQEGDVLLVKGSRFLKLEKVVQDLLQQEEAR